MQKSKNSQKVFCFGENHASSHNPKEGVYAALNAMNDADLKKFIESNNIKHAFFEFILSDDFPLEFKKGLAPKKNDIIMVCAYTQNDYNGDDAVKFKDDKYKHIESFAEFKKLQPNDFISLTSALARNAYASNDLVYAEECGSIGNVGTYETYQEQQILANKIKGLGVEIYGIESVEAFKSAHGTFRQQLSKEENKRLPSLNKDGTDIIDKTLKAEEGNAFLVAGNAHFVDCDKTKGMQTLLADKGYDCATVLLTTKSAMNDGKIQYKGNNIEALMSNVVEKQEDFHARVNELSAATRKEEYSGILSDNFAANQSQQKLGSISMLSIQEQESNQRNFNQDWEDGKKPVKKQSCLSKLGCGKKVSKIYPVR